MTLPTPVLWTESVDYLGLQTYLENRFADTVVLTFTEIEDLLGFALPELAREQAGWWSNGTAADNASLQATSWIRAGRAATPKMMANAVSFARVV